MAYISIFSHRVFITAWEVQKYHFFFLRVFFSDDMYNRHIRIHIWGVSSSPII